MPSNGNLLFGFVDGPHRLTNLSLEVSVNVVSASIDFLFGEVSTHTFLHLCNTRPYKYDTKFAPNIYIAKMGEIYGWYQNDKK